MAMMPRFPVELFFRGDLIRPFYGSLKKKPTSLDVDSPRLARHIPRYTKIFITRSDRMNGPPNDKLFFSGPAGSLKNRPSNFGS